MAVNKGMYRFRILNGSISRGYRLALSSGSFYVIGTDAGLLPAPVKTNDLRIGMAERYDILIDFTQYAAGAKVVLKNLGVPNSKAFDSTRQIMRFDVQSTVVKTSTFTAATRFTTPDVQAIMALTESQVTKKRDFRLEHRADGMWTINGKMWDPDRVDASPTLGSVELWTITNKSGGWFHPFHIHLIDFKVIRRNGSTTAVRAYEKGAKDVVYVGENETVDLLMKFGPHRGKYMMHCHNLVHEDHDMMTQFEVLGSNGEENEVIVSPYTASPQRWYQDCPPSWEKDL
jgi:FtsP/CotA-like multicopper oxidase with cupredoxin domain